MPLLRKVADCLGVMYAAPSRSPVIANTVSPVGEPEVIFGWQGQLFSSDQRAGVVAVNTPLAKVTIVEDCFYTLDATCNVSEQPAAPGILTRRLALDILDPAGKIAYQLVFGFFVNFLTAVGFNVTPPPEIYGLRMHLLNGMIIQWENIDVIGPGAAVASVVTSIALRKLYQDQL